MAFSEANLNRRLNQAVERASRKTFQSLRSAALPHSRTLYTTMERSTLSVRGRTKSVTLSSPFFWSTIVDQGRKGFTSGTSMIAYFKDIKDDPRVRGGYHKSYARAMATRLRLPSAEFREAVATGRLRLARSVGPAAATNFVAKGTKSARKDLRRELNKAMLDTIKETAGRKVRKTLKFSIG